MQKSASEIVVRPATREDIDAYSDMENKPTIRAWVALLDGQQIGIGGVALYRGRHYAFVDLKDDVRPYKMKIMRTAIRFLEDAQRDGIKYIYAEASPDEPKSVAWLTSLGFRIDPRSQQLYRWSGRNV